MKQVVKLAMAGCMAASCKDKDVATGCLLKLTCEVVKYELKV